MFVLIIYMQMSVAGIYFDNKDMCDAALAHAQSQPNVTAFCELRTGSAPR